VSHEEWDPYLACMQIVHEIVHRIVRQFLRVLTAPNKFSPHHVLKADVAAHSRRLVYKLNDRDCCARDRLDVDDLGQRAEGKSSQTNLIS
jgi:hypothetical protein